MEMLLELSFLLLAIIVAFVFFIILYRNFAIQNNRRCECQSCTDSDRLDWSKVSVNTETKYLLIDFWRDFHHSRVGNQYIQGEYIVFFSLIDLLVYKEGSYTLNSIAMFRTRYIQTIRIYYTLFTPESLSIFSQVNGYNEYSPAIASVLISKMTPSCLLRIIDNVNIHLLFLERLFVLCNELIAIDVNCITSMMLARTLCDFINPDLLVTFNRINIGMKIPDNRHDGITFTDLTLFDSKKLSAIFDIIPPGIKIRVDKNIDITGKFVIDKRWYFFTHVVNRTKTIELLNYNL